MNEQLYPRSDMTQENREKLTSLLRQYEELGIGNRIDYDKFYLYSIITHSTAIEGSTVTEEEARLLFDEGITSGRRTMMEQMMNLDLKEAYYYGKQWIMQHDDITIDRLIALAAKVMARTGSEYHSAGGDFSAAKGELRRLNVMAGIGGKSYLSYLKVPQRLEAFCTELNHRRKAIVPTDIVAVYELSFWAHFELVTIHPWADGNGRTCRLLMNLLQMEYGVLPTKVLKEDKAEYIQSLIDTRENNDIQIFYNSMTMLHCRHLKQDIAEFMVYEAQEMVDKRDVEREMVDKWSIKPSLVKKLVDILVFARGKEAITTELIVRQFHLTPTTAKRYLRQLSEFGYMEPRGGNRNKSYKVKMKNEE